MIFVLFSISVSAWQTYQNDLRNSGFASGTGYFPLETANFSIDGIGMDFQPLADDLDDDGKNEIIIFSNSSLILFNQELKIINQIKVGSTLGQPTLFDFDNDNFFEIIFNARQNSTDYFFVYTYKNSSLQQEFNITLPHEANFSGIKCLAMGNSPLCIFKDKKNYVHVVNLSSRIDDPHNTSIFEEYRQTIPAIGDIDNDGNMEAVFWFNADNTSGYGFLVFDLSKRKIKWVVDNIFSPLILGPSLFHQLFTLKGQPVLVDLNGDGKLEIAASAFYDDFIAGGFSDDWFTELMVYSPNGSKLFSKCGLGFNGCNDNQWPNNLKMEGTNPFVMDYDKNGLNDICFIKDEKNMANSGSFWHMVMNCYNYNGDEIADVILSNFPDGVQGTAMAADMNNDGDKEIITQRGIFALNGKNIFSFPLSGTVHPIAVDVDGNRGLDLVWTGGNRTKVYLDENDYSVDLSIAAPDLTFSKFNETHIKVNSIIKNLGQLEAKKVKAIIYNIDTLENDTQIFDIKGSKNTTLSSVIGIKQGDKILVSVDFENEINESDETNNLAIKEFDGLPYVYISIGAEQNPQLALQEIKDYIKNNLVAGYFTEDLGAADVAIYLGKSSIFNSLDRTYTRSRYGWGYDSFSTIDYFDRQFDEPYAGLVGSYKLDGSSHIAIYGNNIEGDIAAAKEFIKHQTEFLAPNSEASFLIDDANIEAIGIYDYLHQPANEQFYVQDSRDFASVVKNALNGEMFTTENKIVTTNDNVSLSLKHLVPNRSSTYLEILNATGVLVDVPVALSRGIHSNLTTWEVLGGELADGGRDTWLIEITGGPGQDCDNCPNYNFSDLTDNYWPALINGILGFTGKDKIQYVGHSNGCRTALESLRLNRVDPNKVDTFIGVGCPGAFNYDSPGKLVFDTFGDEMMTLLQNKTHLSADDIGITAKKLCFKYFGVLSPDDNLNCRRFSSGYNGEGKISFNLAKNYNEWINNMTDSQPGQGLNFDYFKMFYGTLGFAELLASGESDGIVAKNDIIEISNGINGKIKKEEPEESYRVLGMFHTSEDPKSSLPDNKRTKEKIKNFLNKQ